MLNPTIKRSDIDGKMVHATDMCAVGRYLDNDQAPGWDGLCMEEATSDVIFEADETGKGAVFGFCERHRIEFLMIIGGNVTQVQ